MIKHQNNLIIQTILTHLHIHFLLAKDNIKIVLKTDEQYINWQKTTFSSAKKQFYLVFTTVYRLFFFQVANVYRVLQLYQPMIKTKNISNSGPVLLVFSPSLFITHFNGFLHLGPDDPVV